MRTKHTTESLTGKKGAALLVALWVLIILSLITGSFAFDMKLESMLVSYSRKRFQAEMLSYSGIEYARAILDMRGKVKELEIADMEDEDGFMQAALYAQRSMPATVGGQLGDGTFTVTIEPVEGSRNVNLLGRAEWLDIFEFANVPSTEWDTMVDCLTDWIDGNDLHVLNGAESDDEFYQEAGYPVKNAPLDSVEELLLVKGWGEDILYGKEADGENEAIYGIADMLTVWGDGKVNINSATTNTLLSYGEYEDWELAGVMEARWGLDGEEGTLDDGIRNLADVGADANKFTLQTSFVKVTSVGELYGSKYGVTCIMLLKNKDSVPVYWQEGPVK